ncbi:myosin type I [Schizosaccharomyces pombe]|uniref:Myosin-1 n=1 Tax=Schizosaccharomyces pombe (strain 972 / ATCC 24843) TaxID=284812 RepID=MYO1_SCHPO|nr:myosin I myo1 [Schizosaccharomyces pombe]Q9Y7Z8.1 RecName: Full=Myosin-1; AltName: Full=Class I unconventional myosin; AltName: Full=Type I myosin [Schizosaccharomyces pombe 972h-]CAB46766.1 myosin type I [Schizosaccharomyces pombe]|eukprot:NP_595402.1 myosin I myo1 [Schizosaccharomyces pombe]
MAILKRTNRAKAATAAAPNSTGKSNGIKKAVYTSTRKKTVGVDDLTLLSKITDEEINKNLELRFRNGEIYTYIGHVLISVNPFRDLGIYTMDILKSYQGKNRLETSPHVYAIAENAYYQMKSYHENQCIIISGESGAGKTEAAKRIMQYITHVSKSVGTEIERVSEIILATNPLLESFGCAKTLRNNNSSRHGKYLEMIFNSGGVPVGAKITNYLLEKNRIVNQVRNERNFHIFYQFTKSAPQKYRDTYGIQGPENYVYTSACQCLSVDGISDEKDFQGTMNAMKVIGITEPEQDEIFRMLSIILWLGNIQFQEGQDGGSVISDKSITEFLGYLIGVPVAAIERALTIRIMQTQHGARRGSVYEVPLNPTQALAVRDALSMAIYNCLFDWIVERVNKALVTSDNSVSNSIGILDIYGFEIFENNSFEQLCINYVNEKLQQIFIELTLKTEQEEYVREQIAWTPIKYFNNKVVCDLIESKRPPGLFAAMNDAIATAHADSAAADSAFAQRLNFLSSNPHFEQRQNQFIVKHYAGDVTYSITGMTDKNKDQLATDILNLIHSSNNEFMKSIFPVAEESNSRRRPPTAGDRIKTSANDLVETLMKCQPSYIRTIKPNQTKSPNDYDQQMVLHQIKYLGLQENIRIRRAGFAYRQAFDTFAQRFAVLSGKTSYAGEYTWQGDDKSACEQILKDTNIPSSEYQMGTSKVFIKNPETLFALEDMRDKFWDTMATRIQRAWRSYVRRRSEAAACIQKLWNRNKVNMELERVRNEGTKLLQGKKQRRRYSILGSRKFYGDYLSASKPNGTLWNTCGLSQNDHVIFSMRCEVLVHKLGRTSKPSPRQLVLTKKNLYLVITKIVDQKLTQQVEKKFAVSSIDSVGLTNLQDDWVAIRNKSSQNGDMFLRCFFKTEFITTLKRINRNIQVIVGPTIQYCRKPGKVQTVKTAKDETTKDYDYYKSGTIHVGTGLPPTSKSKPFPRLATGGSTAAARGPRPVVQNKPAATKPVSMPAAKSKPAPMANPVSTAQQTQNRPPAPAMQARPNTTQAAAPVTSTTTTIKQATTVSASKPAPSTVTSAASSPSNISKPSAPVANNVSKPSAVPPPPPPPPAEVEKKDLYLALYDFAGRSPNEMTIKKDEIIEIVQKEPSGWWLALKNGAEGWVPATYVTEYKGSTPQTTASSTNVAAQANNNASPAEVNNLAGSLADALRMRASAVRGSDEEEDW